MTTDLERKKLFGSHLPQVKLKLLALFSKPKKKQLKETGLPRYRQKLSLIIFFSSEIGVKPSRQAKGNTEKTCDGLITDALGTQSNLWSIMFHMTLSY